MPEYNLTENTADQLVRSLDGIVEATVALLTRLDTIIATGAGATTGTAVGTNTNPERDALKAALNAAVEGSIY